MFSGDSVTRASSRLRSPFFVGWVLVGVACLAARGYSLASWSVSVGTLSAACLVLGLWVFWRHGHDLITATGLFSFAFALFVGFAGLFALASYRQGQYVPWLLPAIATSFFSHVILYCLWWYDDRTIRLVRGSIKTPDRKTTSWGIATGALVVVPCVIARLAGYESTLIDQTAFTGTVLLCAAMFLRRGRGLGPLSLGVATGLFYLFAQYIFTGFGRLELGALGLALAVTACFRYRGRLVKGAIIVAAAPVMVYFAQQRVLFTAAINPAQASSVTGFESAVTPLVDFGELIGRSLGGEIAPRGLAPFFASAVALFPRSLWPSKPVGLGSELADLFRPELRGTGHSELALVYGEWVYAFGVVGVVVLVPLLGYGVRQLDVFAAPILTAGTRTIVDLVRLTWLIVLIAGLPDLVWGGTFTYISRTGSRSLILVLLLIVAVLSTSRRAVSVSDRARIRIEGFPQKNPCPGQF